MELLRREAVLFRRKRKRS